MLQVVAGKIDSENKLLIFVLLFVIGCFTLVIASPAAGQETGGESPRVIYSGMDPVGDDHGPGDYIYPRHEVFEPYEGLFDLKEFSLKKAPNYYLFSFEFKRITDPWQGEYNFSHQLIHLYLDTGEGGRYDLFRPGARVKLSADNPWNHHLRLSGWWLRHMRPDDDPRDLIRDLDIDAETSPWDVEEGIITRKENVIRVLLPREVIPESLQGANFYLFVGSFDPFGEDYFRDVKSDRSNWAFAAPGLKNSEQAPRIIDWFHPREGKQETILSDSQHNEPVLPALEIPEPEIPARPFFSPQTGKLYILVNLGLGLIIVLYIVYLTIYRADS